MEKNFYEKLNVDMAEDRGRQRGVFYNTLKTIGLLMATILLAELLRQVQDNTQNLILIYVVSVLIISRVTPGYSYGIVAAVVSTFAYDYFVTEPSRRFSITVGSPITLFVMLLATFITSTLTIQMKSQALLSREREHRAQLLYEINNKLLVARDVETVVRLANAYLILHLNRSVIFYTADPAVSKESSSLRLCGPQDQEIPFYSPEEQKRVHLIFRTGAESAVVSEQETERVRYVPIVFKDNVRGVIGIDCRARPLTPSNITFIHMLVGQVALAMELQSLSNEQNEILVAAEREKTRSALLRAISHDLRTPLTSVLGASSTILEQKDMPEEMREGLVRDIQENSQWLIRMVENILTVTRISGNTVALHKTLEAAEEVVAQAVDIVRKRFPDCSIHVRVPGELLVAPMDATLISQVLINLLENAVKNSPVGSLILMDVSKQGAYIRFDVSDLGRGIPDYLLENLFEAHSPTAEPVIDAIRGMGLGLSICRTIVEAHGGHIEGYNKEEGGAKFYFMLPLCQ